MDNQPDPRPVFEADQVITFYDIMGIRDGYIYQYNRTPWFQFKQRLLFRAATSVCSEMLHWLAHGKPADGVKCKGGHTYGL